MIAAARATFGRKWTILLPLYLATKKTQATSRGWGVGSDHVFVTVSASSWIWDDAI